MVEFDRDKVLQELEYELYFPSYRNIKNDFYQRQDLISLSFPP